MSNEYQNGSAATQAGVAVHEGLRSFLIRTFNYMALGVAFTGVVAFFLGSQIMATFNGEQVLLSGFVQLVYTTPLHWALMFAPLVLSFLFGGAIWTSRPALAHAMFWTFAAVFALATAPLYAFVPTNTIFMAFLMASIGFAALSLYGYTTKADLTTWGSFGRIGILVAIVASIVMIFFPSPVIMKVINVVVAVASLALTAFSIQMLKGAYFAIASGQMNDGQRSVEQQLESAAIAGALSLYINFMNLFMSLISLLRGGD